MQPSFGVRRSRVAATPPPPRPRNLDTTVEEILLRRKREVNVSGGRNARRQFAFPPPRHPYGLFSKIAENPGLAALGAYGLWMVGWGYYLWSLAAES